MLRLIITRCEEVSALDPAGPRQQVFPLWPVSHGPENGDGLGRAGRDIGSKIMNQKEVLGTSTEFRHELSFRTREHKEKKIRKKSKNMLGHFPVESLGKTRRLHLVLGCVVKGAVPCALPSPSG